LIGSTVGHYLIREKLGEGGMGEVWLAEDSTLQRRVALKFLSGALQDDETARRRFLREARSAAALDHPFICKIYEAGQWQGRDYLAMEYVPGHSLKERLQEGPLTIEEFFRLAGEVTEALQEAHHRRIVHRDLKPSNLMLTPGGHCKVMDFGLAKRLVEGEATRSAEGSDALTRQGSVVGTLAYMAPDQLAGGEADPRSDIFSLGVVFYEALSGVHPFRRETLVATLGAIAMEDPPPLRQRRADLSARLEAVTARMLAKDPRQRQQTVVELQTELAEALEESQRRHLRRRPAGERSGPRPMAVSAPLAGIRPYPGLAAFTRRQAEFFYGREVEVEQMWAKLGRSRLLGLIGATGSGKSSFLRAGLMPAAPPGWGIVLSTPGHRPLVQLGRELAEELAGDTEAIRTLVGVEAADQAFEAVCRWRQRHREALLVVDQFEELFTLNDETVQRNFAGFLGRLAGEADVRVLLSMRDDFLMRCHGFPELEPIFADLTPLSAPTGQALRRALVEPAGRFGYEFEDESLVEGMLEQVTGERGALPLLAFAAAEMWERRDAEQGLLTRQAYEEIGGVAGALAQHAEATLERIGPERAVIVREIFRNLVTAQGTRAVMEREELLSAFPERGSAEEVLGLLVDARLLTSYETRSKDGSGNGHRIEVVHESLLKAWPRLVRWQAQDQEGAVLRDQLRQAARLWAEKGKTEDLLWTGTAYQEFSLWKERYPGGLTALEDEFARSMAERARRRRRLRQVLVVAALVVMAVVTGTVSVLWQRSVESESQARAEALRAEASKLLAIAQLKIAEDPAEALAYTTASLETSDTPQARLFALKALAEGPPVMELGDLPQLRRPVFSPEGKYLAATGFSSEGRVWAEDGSMVARLDGHQFDPRGGVRVNWAREDLLVTGLAALGSQIRVWSIPEGTELRTVHFEAPTAWTAGHGRLFTFTELPGATGWRRLAVDSWLLPDGEEQVQGRVEPPAEATRALSMTPDGKAFLYGRGTSLYLHSLLQGQKPDPLLSRHESEITAVGDFRKTRQYWAREKTGRIRIWRVEGSTFKDPIDILKPETAPETILPEPSLRWVWTQPLLRTENLSQFWSLQALPGSRPVTLRRSGNWCMATCDVHPSGNWVVCSGNDSSRNTFWPLPDSPTSIVDGYRVISRPVAFSPDSRWLASGWEDNGLRLWPLPGTGTRTFRPLGNARVLWRDLDYDPAGRFLFAVGISGNAWIFPLDGSPERQLQGFGQDTLLEEGAVSPSGRRVATGWFYGGGEKSLRVWDLETGSVQVLPLPEVPPPSDADSPTETSGYEGGVVSMFFEGESILYTSGSGGIRRWDLESGANTLVYSDTYVRMWRVGATRTVYVSVGWTPGAAKYKRDFNFDLVDLDTGESRPAPELEDFADSLQFLHSFVMSSVVAGGSAQGLVRLKKPDGTSPTLLAGHLGPATWVAISPDLKWVASTGEDNTLRLWPMPDLSKPPLHTLPQDELIAKLKSLTNLRAVPDPAAENGWKIELDKFPIELDKFPGWKEFPSW